MKLRALTAGERALAQSVFGGALDTGKLRLLIGAPTGGWAMVLWRLMLFPVGCPDFSGEPVERQAWFVHELTHAWQFQHRPLGTVMSWAATASRGGYIGGRGYRYPMPPDWKSLNLEQQARLVEHIFLVRSGVLPRDLSPEAVAIVRSLHLPWEFAAS